MSVSEVIDKIKTNMAAVDPNGPRKVIGVIQLNINSSDQSTQNWIWDLKNLTINEGLNEAADTTIDINDETLIELANKTITICDADSSGKIVVSGDKKLLAALQCSF